MKKVRTFQSLPCFRGKAPGSGPAAQPKGGASRNWPSAFLSPAFPLQLGCRRDASGSPGRRKGRAEAAAVAVPFRDPYQFHGQVVLLPAPQHHTHLPPPTSAESQLGYKPISSSPALPTGRFLIRRLRRASLPLERRPTSSSSSSSASSLAVLGLFLAAHSRA